MKTLLVLDEKNYQDTVRVLEKFAVRGIIRKKGKLAVQQAGKKEYKLLGGGVEKGENLLQTLQREIREEGGLLVKRSSVQPIGEIIEIRRDIYDPKTKYICHSLFYYCDVEDETVAPQMTESEIARNFHLEWVTPERFVLHNQGLDTDMPWVKRDTIFVQMLIDKEV